MSWKRAIMLCVKIGITALSGWYVYTRIDWGETGRTVSHLRWEYLLPAGLFFAVSKAVSAERLGLFLHAVPVSLSRRENYKLYVLGMFYNLFLPGGIGGDGYKVYWLNRRGQGSVTALSTAVLLDRINGMLAIVALSLLSLLLLPEAGGWVGIAAVPGVALGYGIYLFAIGKLLPSYSSVSHITTLCSAGVQLLQCVSVLFIMRSLSIEHHHAALLVIFMVSSVVAALPFTVGGLGAREIVFLTGSRWLMIDPGVSIGISLIFYLITALVSLTGIWFHFRPVKTAGENN